MGRGLIVCCLCLVMGTLGRCNPARAADLAADQAESWDPGPREVRFASMAEERFQMESDYLGITGDRKDKARKLYESLMSGRERIIKSRDMGWISRVEAIAGLDSLDLKYYLKLRGKVKGGRNLARLERMIRKAGARSGEDSSALTTRESIRIPGQ